MPGTQTSVSAAVTMPLTYVNPWAECWGSGHPCTKDQIQGEASSVNNPIGDDKNAQQGECNCTPEATMDGGIVRVLPIINHKGLHARASAKFVQTVEGFDAAVKVTRCGETVGGQSIMGLMMLAAANGTSIIVETAGPQAEACMEALSALLADKFGEEA